MYIQKCSRTCRGGFQSREVTCVIDEDEDDMGNTTIVDTEICLNFSKQELPETTVDCNFNIICPVRFLPSAFQPVIVYYTCAL